MTNTRLGTLTRLFDEIKTGIDEGALEFGFVRNNLGLILEGPKLPRPTISGNLILKKTFLVESSPKIEEMKTYGNGWHRTYFEGYPDTTLQLGPFFFKGGSPATDGGEAAVLTCSKRLSITEFLQELFEGKMMTSETLESEVVTNNISFSIKQVMEIISSGAIERDKRSSVFLVHRFDGAVAAATISCTKRDLFGKDLGAIYPYAPGTKFIVRNLPKHLQPT